MLTAVTMLSSCSSERTIPEFVIVSEAISNRFFFFSGKVLLKSEICAQHKNKESGNQGRGESTRMQNITPIQDAACL